MHVVVVTPLIRGTQLESLSYFSSIAYEIGSFVSVPIRGKTQSAIVTAVRPATASKTALKAASFSLRKLPQQPDTRTLPKALRDTATALESIYPASAGALLYQLLPSDVRNGSRPYPEYTEPEGDEDSTPHVLTARSDDRMITYESAIRSAFAKQQSVLIAVPTAAFIPQLLGEVSAGIKDRVITFSPLQTKRQRDKAFEQLQDTSQAKVIIATPAQAYLVRKDIGLVIIEHSGSSHYVTRTRPYLDHREGLKAFAKSLQARLILGDTVPTTEDEFHRRDGTYETLGEEVKRQAFPAPLTIVTQHDKANPQQSFQLFSDELVHAVNRAAEGRGRVFLYAARRGLAPVVFCLDCSHIFRCPDSGTPYSLLRTYNQAGEEERWFVSSTSGRRERAADVCPHCGSWRLRERGIGIQQVADEWQEKFPDTPITVIDQTTAKTQKDVQKQCQDFFSEKSGVLIGTQVVLPYLSAGVAVSAIISLDAARSIPTWRADESLFRLLLRLRECTSQEVIVQTRTEVDNLLTYASRGALERFYDDEIDLRRMVQYPPLVTFILLTWTGPEKACRETEDIIRQTLGQGAEIMQCYNNPNSNREKTVRYGLIPVPATTSNKDATVVSDHTALLQKLRTLPPYVKVEVNPEKIV